MMRLLAPMIATSLLAAASLASAQSVPPPPLDRPLRVFIDCRGGGCDQEFFRNQLHWIDHVRDQRDADIHLLITQQQTGGGGNQYTIRVLGRGRWDGEQAAVRISMEAGEPQDALRRALVRTFALLLARYAAETPVGPKLMVVPPAVGSPANQTVAGDDPWNFWVFRMNLNSFFNGEKNSKFGNVNISASANRTTEALKVNIDTGFNYSANQFELSGGRFTSYVRGRRFNTLVVKSLNDHWSAGAMLRVSRSTFENHRLSMRVAPGIEYNVFRYAESTNRQLTVQWTAGYRRFKYDQLTIFNKLEESRWDEQLLAILSLRQPFGSVRLTGEVAHYFDNLDQHRFSVFADNEIRLFRGFSLSVDGNYQVLQDQLYLPRRGASDEEIIARQQQLQTSYRYFLSLGVTYRFGSINNNVVNQRFGG
jgi:hypothetical protein